MPLYDPQRVVHVDPRDAVAVARDFMVRCRDWAAQREIPARLERVCDGLDPVEAGKLHAWVAWMRFCEHAIAELEDGRLDAWFLDGADGPDASSRG